MRELRRKNEELEKEREEGEKERERMLRCIDQLRTKLAQAQVTLPAKHTHISPGVQHSNVARLTGIILRITVREKFLMCTASDNSCENIFVLFILCCASLHHVTEGNDVLK